VELGITLLGPVIAWPHIFGFAFRRVVLDRAAGILGVVRIEDVCAEEAGFDRHDLDTERFDFVAACRVD